MKTTANQYAKVLFEMTFEKTQEEIDEAISRFAKTLVKDRRVSLSRKIMKKFEDLWNMKKNILEVEVTSQKDLTGEVIEKIRKNIEEKYGIKEMDLKKKVDANMKGGIIIRVGDDLIDASLDNRLKNLKNFLEK